MLTKLDILSQSIETFNRSVDRWFEQRFIMRLRESMDAKIYDEPHPQTGLVSVPPNDYGEQLLALQHELQGRKGESISSGEELVQWLTTVGETELAIAVQEVADALGDGNPTHVTQTRRNVKARLKVFVAKLISEEAGSPFAEKQIEGDKPIIVEERATGTNASASSSGENATDNVVLTSTPTITFSTVDDRTQEELLEEFERLPDGTPKETLRAHLNAVKTMNANPSEVTDRAVYDYIRADGTDLDKWDTWARNLRRAREKMGIQKHNLKSTPHETRSIVGPGGIQNRQPERV